MSQSSTTPRPKLLLHVIDSLTFGGAEILLKNSISLLPQFRHLIVYLDEPGDLKSLFPVSTEFICLHHKGWGNVLGTCRKLRKIIKERQPVLVHTHLLKSIIIARLAVPRNTPLVSTIHSLYSEDVFKKNNKGLLAERLTIKKQRVIISVSKYVLQDYLKWIPFKGKSYVVYDFLPHVYFKDHTRLTQNKNVRCVAVGNLKEAKNYFYLLQIFQSLKEQPISLDIYGIGGLQTDLQNEIDKNNLRVVLKGHLQDIPAVLPHYDIFIQSSAHEGFGLSVIEAIAARVPVFISRIPVFEEITNGHAHFFSLNNAEAASAALLKLCSSHEDLHCHVNEAYAYAKQHFSEEVFAENIEKVYSEMIGVRGQS